MELCLRRLLRIRVGGRVELCVCFSLALSHFVRPRPKACRRVTVKRARVFGGLWVSESLAGASFLGAGRAECVSVSVTCR